MVFFLEKGEPQFLLLHRVLNWQGWEFAKGGVESGEEHDKAVLREISEEAGITDSRIVWQLAKDIVWEAKGKKYVYSGFLVESKTKKVIVQQDIQEHDDFKWVNAKQAMELLKHKENKMLLEKTLEFFSQSKELQLIVSGRVQKVFFRAYVQNTAKEIGGVTGFVENLANGNVKVVAQANSLNLLVFLEKIKKGPPLAKVESVAEKWVEPQKKYSDFEIK